MSIVLFDTPTRKNLFPLTYTRAVADIRMGIVTLKEWWQKLTDHDVYVSTEAYLTEIYPLIPPGTHFWIDANVLPTDELIQKLNELKDGEALADEIGLIAIKAAEKPSAEISNAAPIRVRRLQYPWQIFQWNDEILRRQFPLFTHLKSSNTSESTHLVNVSDIFIEDSAVIEHAVLNASTGPIYIGKNVVIMEGSYIRGPFAIGDNSTVKMGAKIYGATTAGPNCVLGGEIKNSVIFGNSNKAHDGYMGDSVIGEWCNWGAGTSNSNVKNTASDICVWDFNMEHQHTIERKCGVIMGDYSRTAINSSINTGSFFGVCCNIFGEGLLPKHISNFSWGAKDKKRYEFDKAIKDINNWMQLKNTHITQQQIEVLKHIFDLKQN